MNVKAGLYYYKDHEWVAVEGDIATVGVSDYAAHQLGDIVYIELPEVDDEVEMGEVFGVVESVKAASDSYSPISGVVVEVNEDLVDAPEGLNSDPYGSWMFKVKMSDPSEIESLMDAAAYEAFIQE